MKQKLPLIAILLGVLLVFIAGGTAYMTNVFQHPDVISLPPLLAENPLTAKSEGWHAIRELTQLHQKEFPLTGGAVGRYGYDNEATLWVAKAPLRWVASRMMADMHARIAEGDSPFHFTGERTHKDHKIYELDGMGQKHFYYQTGNQIIWLAVDVSLAEESLSHTLAFYR